VRYACFICILVGFWENAASFSSTIEHRRSTARRESNAGAAEVITDDTRKMKADLISACKVNDNVRVQEICNALETLSEGLAQTSASSGLLGGEWELLYSSEDDTRSSPFFWAFRKAFPGSSDEIFRITDSIPSPIKDVGPATQTIEYDDTTKNGRFTSRVKVATLGGVATSIMTTRASIVGASGLDGVRLKIETTKPEDSTIIRSLFGPLGDVINENSPPFPSGEALERARPGSSEVVLRSPYCDEGIRISRNDDRPDEVYVWQRKAFSAYSTI